ncbi:nucleotide disphospho-sugar-binding domain-containing protein [Kutzneria albida]|uniref:Uncharacterized protein n=1 Tax=Kutzneria albida DSM 43870 TaxID=1449976 RepID=W5W1V8_9PSEU|nr:nucleotide disphospho-sugar-binding domain-containing protein [Kutzneria albida]AHH94847.1 hypothetical protein KALB_1474 [Kutzneria albida DSM 43870]
MRVLIVCLSAHGHLFPMISTGWALRAAGHEVLIATCGGLTPVERTGLPSVDLAPGFSMAIPEGMDVRRSAAPPIAEQEWAGFFAFTAEVMAEGLAALVGSWRPDVLLHEETLLIGSAVAIGAGVPSVAHGLGLAHGLAEVDTLFEPQLPLFSRFGVHGLPEPTAVIDLSPPSMGSVPGGWPMRYVPYNGPGMLPEWLLDNGDRPRVAVTLGTFNPYLTGVGPAARVVELAAELDAEFVLALGSVDTSSLGPLPPNVRISGWVPLHALLATCSAVIHHGGTGTTMTALDAGLPQLIMPADADQPLNAEAGFRRGLALVSRCEQLGAKQVGDLLRDPDLRRAAAEVRAEMHAMPAPGEVAQRILGLVRG